jgi:ornithine--oxo-acid transaminase
MCCEHCRPGSPQERKHVAKREENSFPLCVPELTLGQSLERGEEFRQFSERLRERYPFLEIVRGRGLFNAFVMKDEDDLAYQLCYKLKERGLLAKPTRGNIIRFAPPLIITKEQLAEGMDIIEDAMASLAQPTTSH